MSRVLLIDDDQELGLMLSDFLATDRLQLTVCNTGEEGIDTFTADDFDLLILDIMLPGMHAARYERS
jgi:DNA-binding response OmpR family regulator